MRIPMARAARVPATVVQLVAQVWHWQAVDDLHPTPRTSDHIAGWHCFQLGAINSVYRIFEADNSALVEALATLTIMVARKGGKLSVGTLSQVHARVALRPHRAAVAAPAVATHLGVGGARRVHIDGGEVVRSRVVGHHAWQIHQHLARALGRLLHRTKADCSGFEERLAPMTHMSACS